MDSISSTCHRNFSALFSLDPNKPTQQYSPGKRRVNTVRVGVILKSERSKRTEQEVHLMSALS